MNKRRASQIAFVLMGVFIIEIIGLIQAIFSVQILKHNLDNQIEYTSEMILTQFIGSYLTNDEIQKEVTDLSYKSIDGGLTKIFKNLKRAISANPSFSETSLKDEHGDFLVEIAKNNVANQVLYNERVGVDLAKIEDYKILSYEINQAARQLMERRILVGISDDRKWIISIEINQKDIKAHQNKTNSELSTLLNSAYYFNDNTGNFYVFSSGGKILYQGGLVKNAAYFVNRDLNTDQNIIDLVRMEKNSYQRVIYEAEKGVNRSLLRIIYDAEHDLYFVYEIDQKRVFANNEQLLNYVFAIGFFALGITFALMGITWRYYKRNGEGSL